MKMIGYKGFDKDLKCRDFQYEVGKEYEHDGKVKLCKSGFHFCENPQGVFGHYAPGNGSRFAIVEAGGVSDERESDSKRVAKKLKIKSEISVFEMCRIAVDVFFENFGFKKKIESAEGNSAGYYGAAEVGEFGVAVVGNASRVKGKKGSVLVARKIEYNHGTNECEVADWACALVDGKEIKEGTWYVLKDGKLVEEEKWIHCI